MINRERQEQELIKDIILSNLAIELFRLYKKKLAEAGRIDINRFSVDNAFPQLHNKMTERLKSSFELENSFWENKAREFTKFKNKVKQNDCLVIKDSETEEMRQIYAFGEIASAELFNQIDSQNLSLKQLETWLGLAAPKPTPVTEPKLRAFEAIQTSPPFRAGLESCYRPDKWKNTKDNWGVFEAPCRQKPSNRVEVYIGGEQDGDILALEASLQVIDLMGIDAAKLQLVFGCHLLNQPDPCNTKFSLKGVDVVRQIGWDKKHRLTVSEKLGELASLAFHLGRMLMRCTWIESKPKGNLVDASVNISPLWVIEVDVRGQMNLLTGKVDHPDEVYITVSPGPWVDRWLNKVGAKAKEALHQFGYLATEILKIDPYHDELALKVAIHLTMQSRIKAKDKNPYEHKVGELLEAVELEARINAARLDKYKARDLKNRWNDVLKLLMNMDWKVIFDDATYPDWLRPDSKAEKPSNWKKEKVIDQLWKAQLTIVPPEPIPALLPTKPKQLHPTKPKGLKSTPSKRSRLTASQVRKSRETKGWSQAQLAGWLGVSRPLIALIEAGHRPIKPELEEKLRELLEIQD